MVQLLFQKRDIELLVKLYENGAILALVKHVLNDDRTLFNFQLHSDVFNHIPVHVLMDFLTSLVLFNICKPDPNGRNNKTNIYQEAV